MSKWFYYNEQGEKIEITGGQLKGLAKTGWITPDTIVETAEGKTAPARRVKGLTFLTAKQSEMVTPESVTPETESYGLSQTPPPAEENSSVLLLPEKNNPFTAALPVEASPFTANPFTEERPSTENPFTASVPVLEKKPIKKVAENVSKQEFDQILQKDIEQSHKEEQFHKSNPFTASMQNTRYTNMPETSHAETVNIFSSVIALLLVILLCGVVGGVIWWLLGITEVIPH